MHEMQGASQLGEELSVSEEGLCYIYSVNHTCKLFSNYEYLQLKSWL